MAAEPEPGVEKLVYRERDGGNGYPTLRAGRFGYDLDGTQRIVPPGPTIRRPDHVNLELHLDDSFGGDRGRSDVYARFQHPLVPHVMQLVYLGRLDDLQRVINAM